MRALKSNALCIILVVSIYMSVPINSTFAETIFRGLHLGQTKEQALSLVAKLGFSTHLGVVSEWKYKDEVQTPFQCKVGLGTSWITTIDDKVTRLELYSCFFDYDTTDSQAFKKKITEAYDLRSWRGNQRSLFATTSSGENVELTINDRNSRPVIIIRKEMIGKF